MWFKKVIYIIFSPSICKWCDPLLNYPMRGYAFLPTSWKHFWNYSLWKLPVGLTFSYINQYQLLAKSWSFESWLNVSKLPKAYKTKTNEDDWWRRGRHKLESITQCDYAVMRLYFSLWLLAYVWTHTQMQSKNVVWVHAYEISS